MDSSTLLELYERCPRAGYFGAKWKRRKLTETEILQEGVRVGVTTLRPDFGQAAGEHCFSLGADPGLISDQQDVYGQVVHLAALADIVTTALRKSKQPWLLAGPVELGPGNIWRSACFLSPDRLHLRRVALVSTWSDDRHYSEARSWRSLGEMCVHSLPMQQAVVVIGQSRNGKRHSWWTHGLRHPVNKQLRFRKRNQVAEGFKATWKEVWREDFDDVTTEEWLQAMLADDVVKDCCFNVDLALPEKAAREGIVNLARRKFEAIAAIKEKPDQNLTTCDWPTVCPFLKPCHKNDEPSGRYGFVQIG